MMAKPIRALELHYPMIQFLIIFISGQFTDAEFCIFVGYVVQGSNGEYAYMKAEEKIALVQKVRELATKDKLILAGSGCEGEYGTSDR